MLKTERNGSLFRQLYPDVHYFVSPLSDIITIAPLQRGSVLYVPYTVETDTTALAWMADVSNIIGHLFEHDHFLYLVVLWISKKFCIDKLQKLCFDFLHHHLPNNWVITYTLCNSVAYGDTICAE